MKRATKTIRDVSNDLRSEYAFDYSKAKPNRFAANLKKGGALVVLEPEVAAVFHRSEDVNAVLRAIVQTMSTRPEIASPPTAKPATDTPKPRSRRRVKL